MTPTASLRARVETALAAIRSPRRDGDVLSTGMVRDLVVNDDGTVRFTFVLTRDDPAGLARQARKAVEAVAGVREVKVEVREPAEQGGGGSPRQAPAAPPPPPTPDELPGLGKVIAVSSGKGGVGKSTVASNLAAALARLDGGQRVGLMDADIYGPNIPRMFGVDAKPEVRGGKIQPLEAHGVKLMSLGLIVERDAPAIWRGPIIMKIIQQFLRDVAWGELDYFLVDLPPGTGDAQLSLTQIVRLHGTLIVTTPQEMAVGDALKGARMFERVNVPVLGIVENMSGFTDPETGKRFTFFAEGGGKRLAEELGLPLLGEVPLQPGLAEAADQGLPVVVSAPDSAAARSLEKIAERLHAEASKKTFSLPVIS